SGGELGLQHLEDVVADHRRPVPGRGAAVTAHHPLPGVVAERDVVVLEPADHRPATRPLPGSAAVEPEAPAVGRGGPGEDLLGRHRSPSPARKAATISGPCSESTDSGWN